MKAPAKILIYRLGSLGDTVLAWPSLWAIRRRFPKAVIKLLTNVPVNVKAAPMLALLEGTGILDGVVSYPLGLRDPGGLRRLRDNLRAEKFDLMVHLAAARGLGKSLRDWVFFRACGIPRIVGLPLRRRDLSCGPDKRHPGQFEWEAARIARRVAPLAVVDLEDAAAWDLALREEEQAEADRLLAAAGMGVDFLVLSVGTKVSAKDWTQPNWLALLRRLATTHAGFGLVAIGSADEATRSAECLAGWPGPSANLCGLTSPRVSAALLQRARLFLGHDSGPMHVAAAVGTACVVVFSARSRPGQWSPRGAGHRLLSRQVPCMGCGLEVCVEHGTKCLLSIPVAEVAAAVDQALGASTRSGAAMSSRAGSLRPLRSLGTIHPALK